MDGAAGGKDGGASSPNQQLPCFRCHRLQQQQPTSCCPEAKLHGCCDACLIEMRAREEQVPSWVRDLAAVDFSAPVCRKNRFCVACLAGFCGARCPTALKHVGRRRADPIEIHVLGEGESLRTFVDPMEVRGLYDSSEIQLEMDLAPAPRLLRELVPLHPRQGNKNPCGNIRIGFERLYCSMECEWQAPKGLSEVHKGSSSSSDQFVQAILAEDFTTGHQADAFCITCRVAFCTAGQADHASHPSVEIISRSGRFFLRVPDTEKWLGNFAFVPEDGQGCRFLPLTPPPTGCECGNVIAGVPPYCSVRCMLKNLV